MPSSGYPRVFRKSPLPPSDTVTNRPKGVRHSRIGAALLVGTLIAFAFPDPAPAQSGEPSPPKSPAEPPEKVGNFAGVFDDSYRPAPPDLKLDRAGTDRAAALAHYFQALRREAAGDSPGAISAYQKTLAHEPAAPRIARRAAELITAAGAGITGGKNLLEAALAAAPDNPSSKLHLSAFLAIHGDRDDRARAVALAKETVREFPENPEALEHYAGLCVATGQGSTAAVHVKNLAAGNRDYPARFWLALARSANLIWPQKKGDTSPLTPGAKIVRARTDGFFARALETDSTDPLIAREAAAHFEHTGRLANAAKVYETLVQKRGDFLMDRLHLAGLYQKLDRNSAAIKELEALAEIDPSQPSIRSDLADLYQAEGQFERAIPHAEQALKLRGGSRVDYLRLGNLLEAAGKRDEWLAHARKTFALFPNSPHAGFMLGRALFEAAEFHESAAVLEKSVILCQAYDRSRLDVEFHLIFGKALARSGEFEKAERTFNKGLEIIPKGSPVSGTVPLLTALAEAQYAAGNTGDAIKNLRRASSASPDDPKLAEMLKIWESTASEPGGNP